MKQIIDSFINTFVDFVGLPDQAMPVAEAFSNLGMVTQIIIGVFLLLCAIGAAVLAFYVLKLVLTFVYKVIRGLFTVLFNIGSYTVPQAETSGTQTQTIMIAHPGVGNQSRAVRAPSQTRASEQVMDTRQVNTQPSAETQTKVETRTSIQEKTPSNIEFHCTNCGNAFSQHMMELLKTKDKVFCEYCGQGFKVD